MADIDVSMYPKAPQGNPLLETAGSAIGVANAAQQNRLLQQQEQAQGIDIGLQQLGILRNAMGAIAANPNASYDDFAGLGALVDQGLINPEFYKTELAKLPPNATPDVYRGIANQYNAQLATVGERYAMQTGIPLGTAGQPVSYTNEVGAPVTEAAGTLAGRLGVNSGFPVGTGGNPLSGGAEAQGTQNPFLTAPEPLSFPEPQAATGPIVAPTQQQQAAWNASVEQFNEARARAASWPARKQPYDELLRILPEAMSGKGTAALSDAAKVLSSLGIPVPEQVNTQAELASLIEKYSAQLATSLPFAGKSDAQLNAAFNVTPGTAMDRDAAIGITKKLYTLARMDQALYATAQTMGIPEREFADFAAEWGSKADPRAFAVSLMDTKERDKLIEQVDSMTPEDQARFWESLALADQQKF